MRGVPVYVECYFALVRVWIDNPIGHSDSDNHVVTITCLNDEEAREIGIRWASVWNVNCYDAKERKMLAEMYGCECEMCEAEEF